MNFLEKEYVQYFNFLGGKDSTELLLHTLQIKDKFSPSTVTTSSDEYDRWRSSREVFRKDFYPFYGLIKDRISVKYFEVCKLLQIEKLTDYELEVHLTAHNHGDYFKQHYDAGTEETNSRVITFIYYFHKVPKQFSGGELILHELEKVSIKPINDMIIFFNPMSLHEVLTVNCPSKSFDNSRFTLNGWILKKD